MNITRLRDSVVESYVRLKQNKFEEPSKKFISDAKRLLNDFSIVCIDDASISSSVSKGFNKNEVDGLIYKNGNGKTVFRMPFNSLIVAVDDNPSDSSNSTNMKHFHCFYSDEGISIMARWDHKYKGIDYRLFVSGTIELDECQNLIEDSNGKVSNIFAGTIKITNRVIHFNDSSHVVEPNEVMNESFRRIFKSTSDVLINLCRDFAYPSNMIVKVSPSNKGKSIEWTKSRTHYRIVSNRETSESIIRLGKGKCSDEEIQRMAHSRRGHFRKLSSPKYINKNGMSVWVREAWIGPKEFYDESQKTIYTIVTE